MYSKDTRSLAIGLSISTGFVVSHFLPHDIGSIILSRILATIVIMVLTEIVADNLGMKSDFGIVTWLAALAHPFAIPVSSFTMHSISSYVPIWSDAQAVILGDEFKASYRSNVNFNEIHSEHSAHADFERVAYETKKTYVVRQTHVFILILAAWFMYGSAGFLFAVLSFSFYLAMEHHVNSDEVIRTNDCSPIMAKEGVYAIERSNLWAEYHIGIGYLQNGTLTTRFHVTKGKPIYIGDNMYKPCYYNMASDTVCYGAAPNLVDISHGDDVVVGLSGPYSPIIVMYRSKAQVTPDGFAVFMGNKSLAGTSGSPVFKETVDENGQKAYKFAGCLGWSIGEGQGNKITEVMKNLGVNTFSETIGTSEIVQHIAHPGSGKTRNITELIHRGLQLYGRVYIAGPTRGVSYELIKAYEDKPIDGLIPRVLIRGVHKSRAPSSVTITTHATALRMILRKDSSMTQPGLWILDESHFQDRSTQALKHYLRDKIKTGKAQLSLYEMTATCYSIKEKKWIYSDSSNYPIEDRLMSVEQMIRSLTRETKKAIVFVSSITGSENTSSRNLAELLKDTGKKVIEINRPNFATSYPMAKEKNDFDVVLATNIAECGVNLDVDVCYDFQKSLKPHVVAWNNIVMMRSTTTRGQQVQRRGRVGRTKPGIYIAPNDKFSLPDVNVDDALHLDLALFIKEFDIQADEPLYLCDEAAKISCPHEHLMYMFAEGEEATISSPLTLSLVMDNRGSILPPDEILSRIMDWSRDSKVAFTYKRVPYEARFFDDRDSDFLGPWHCLVNMEDHRRGDDEAWSMIARRTIRDIVRKLRNRNNINPRRRSRSGSVSSISEAENEPEDSRAGASLGQHL